MQQPLLPPGNPWLRPVYSRDNHQQPQAQHLHQTGGDFQKYPGGCGPRRQGERGRAGGAGARVYRKYGGRAVRMKVVDVKVKGTEECDEYVW